MKAQEETFTLRPEGETKQIVDALAEHPDLHREPAYSASATGYDTFDWRLHEQGGTLIRERRNRREARLVWQRADEHLDRRLEPRERLGFAWDLPPGPMRERLEPILEMRRLLPMVEIRSRNLPFRMLDRERKTVARLRLVELEARTPGAKEGTELPSRVVATPVRGYRRAYARLLARFEGLPIDEEAERLLPTALEAIGCRPGGYTSKVKVRLEPELPAGRALTLILQRLLDTLRVNEDGTRRDLDSEFLHDFRVSVRRTRSALGQLKQLVPAEPLQHFREEFRWLGGKTGPTRDLDVYLLKYPEYASSLPPHVGEELSALRDFLVRRQSEEQRRLARVLRSTRYRRLIDEWAAFLASGLAPGTGASERPVLAVANERIWKAARRVLRDGERAIEHRSPAEDLHRLRIDGKKFRYLMEFFRPLYPKSEIDPLIRSLKQLQDNLGDFNDYEVQQGALRSFARDMAEATAPVPVEALMAMGRLVARLEKGQEQERLRFQSCFEAFSTGKNRRLMKRLFRPGK